MEPIQDSHLTIDELTFAFKETKWMYVKTTHEMVSVFRDTTSMFKHDVIPVEVSKPEYDHDMLYPYGYADDDVRAPLCGWCRMVMPVDKYDDECCCDACDTKLQDAVDKAADDGDYEEADDCDELMAVDDIKRGEIGVLYDQIKSITHDWVLGGGRVHGVMGAIDVDMSELLVHQYPTLDAPIKVSRPKIDKAEVMRRYHNFMFSTPLVEARDAIVGAGAALVMLGLRELTDDIDMEVQALFHAMLVQYSTYPKHGIVNTDGTAIDIVEWDDRIDLHPTLDPSIKTIVIDGVTIYAPEEILKQKRALNREKDKPDIAALEAYLALL